MKEIAKILQGPPSRGAVERLMLRAAIAYPAFLAGHELGSRAKEVHKALRLLVTMQRVPYKVEKWWSKHHGLLTVLTHPYAPYSEGSSWSWRNPFTGAEGSLEEAETRLRLKGQEELAYGPVLRVTAFRRSRLGWYHLPSDTIFLEHPKDAMDYPTLYHELGHRKWRGMSPAQKSAWADHHFYLHSLAPPDALGQALSHMEVVRQTRQKVYYREGGATYSIPKSVLVAKVKGRLFPSDYATTDPEEHFCESFSYWLRDELRPRHEQELLRIL